MSVDAGMPCEHILAGDVVPPCVSTAAEIAWLGAGAGVIAVAAFGSGGVGTWAVGGLQDLDPRIGFFVDDQCAAGEGERIEAAEL